MTDKHEEAVPGVTLWYTSSSLVGTATVDEKGQRHLRVRLQLDCDISDEELWKIVEQKFKDGFRVFTVPDFHVEVIDVLRSALKELKDKNILLERQVAQEKDSRLQLQRELDQYKAPLSALGRALGG